MIDIDLRQIDFDKYIKLYEWLLEEWFLYKDNKAGCCHAANIFTRSTWMIEINGPINKNV